MAAAAAEAAARRSGCGSASPARRRRGSLLCLLLPEEQAADCRHHHDFTNRNGHGRGHDFHLYVDGERSRRRRIDLPWNFVVTVRRQRCLDDQGVQFSGTPFSVDGLGQRREENQLAAPGISVDGRSLRMTGTWTGQAGILSPAAAVSTVARFTRSSDGHLTVAR